MIVRHTRAVESIIDHAAYLLEQGGSDVAERFICAVEASLKRLEDAPRVGRSWGITDLPGVRVWRVKGFPKHLLFYQPVVGGIELLYLFHASQDIAAQLAAGNEPDQSDIQ